MTFVLAFRVRVFGQLNVPRRGGVLIVSNHQSYLDPVLLSLGFERSVSFMARRTLFRNRAFGRLIAALNAFPVTRGGLDIAAMREAVRRLQNGECLVVFPEGTRTSDGKIAPLRPGILAIAERADVPIVPAVIEGAFEAWPRGSTPTDRRDLGPLRTRDPAGRAPPAVARGAGRAVAVGIVAARNGTQETQNLLLNRSSIGQTGSSGIWDRVFRVPAMRRAARLLKQRSLSGHAPAFSGRATGRAEALSRGKRRGAAKETKMVDELMLNDMNVDRAEIDREVEAAMADPAVKDLDKAVDESIKSFESGSIIKGKVINIIGDDVVVDVGYKSEGLLPLNEFSDSGSVKPGDEIEVLLDAVEDDAGVIVLSKRKADRIRGWEKIITDHKEGDVVTGRVMRKIKGGLLVDIGVPVFLPASQVNIRRPGDIAEYIGKEVTCKILKIDEERRNIVVSRRKLIEEEREQMKAKVMAEIQVGQTPQGHGQEHRRLRRVRGPGRH